MSGLSIVDRWLFRHAGYLYLRTTRDDSTFDRIAYVTRIIRDISRPVRVLDVGCGGALTLYMFERDVPELVSGYVGLDWNASRLYDRYARCSIPCQFFDVNLDDDWYHGQFDLAFCSECLEHILDDAGVFRKICRSVRAGGEIVVTMPSESALKAFGAALPELLETSSTQDGRHVRIGYTPDTLRKITAGSPAELIRIDAVTKCDETYLHRRYRWPAPLQLFRGSFYAMVRTEKDRYRLRASPADLTQYCSIAAVYRVNSLASNDPLASVTKVRE